MANTSNKKKRVSGKGSIVIIAMLFLASAGLRLSIDARAAWAEGDLAEQFFSGQSDQETEQSAATSETGAAALLEALQRRESAVAEKEMQLKLREKSLDVAQTEIERRIDALEKAEKRLSATLALADTAAEDDLAQLTVVYENMKPKDAAALFQAMEPDFAAGFLARMRPDSAAKILAGLDPQKAYSVSAILAGRNASVPKN